MSANAQKPDWLKKKYRDKEYSTELYLTGYIYDNKKADEGIAASVERVKVMAKGEIAQGLISEIQADHTLKTVETDDAFSQSFESNILSEAKAEIYRITVEGYYDKADNMVYGFAFAKRSEVIQYYKTNIDKYMQEIASNMAVAEELIKKNDLDNAEKELNETKPYFVKIEFATDFIVLINSAPLDNRYTQEIRNLKYSVDKRILDIAKMKTAQLFVLEYNYDKYYILPDDLNGTYTWINAISTCQDLVAFDIDNWEVPSKHLLNEMFAHKSEIKNFKISGAYWSSDEKDASAWGRQFSANGMAGFGDKAGSARVRCVGKIEQ